MLLGPSAHPLSHATDGSAKRSRAVRPPRTSMAMHPPDDDDPIRRLIRRPPPIHGPKEPLSYTPGFRWAERLQGVLLVALGLLSLGGVYVFFIAAPLPAAPSGARGPGVPGLVGAATYLVPFLATGALGLIVVGVRRIMDP